MNSNHPYAYKRTDPLLLPVICGVIAFIACVTYLFCAVPSLKEQCLKQYKDFKPSYENHIGCIVEVDGKRFPASNLTIQVKQ